MALCATDGHVIVIGPHEQRPFERAGVDLESKRRFVGGWTFGATAKWWEQACGKVAATDPYGESLACVIMRQVRAWEPRRDD